MAKIAFFGTSDRSIPILNSLNNSFDVVLCVTKSDTLVGRHQKIRETSVKLWAKENRVQYVTLNKLSVEETLKLKEQIVYSGAIIGIVADFSFMIPDEIINVFEYKMVNVHFSLLPKYRGASPVQAAILNGDKNTGITFAIVVKKLDAGPVLERVEYSLGGKKTAGEVYEDLFILAAEKLPDVITKYIGGKISPQAQEEKEATYTYSKTLPDKTIIDKKDAKINWNDSPIQIEGQIRAYNPWPIAWTSLHELAENICPLKDAGNAKKRVKIYKAHLENEDLFIDELQVEGSKIIDWESFKNGYLDCKAR